MTTNYGATLRWDAPTKNADGSCYSDPGGYKLYYGDSPGVYDPDGKIVGIADAALSCELTETDSETGCGEDGKITKCTYTIGNLNPGEYFFAITAYDKPGNESDYSNEVSVKIP